MLFELLIVFLLVVLALTILSGAAPIVLHLRYGPTLPPHVAKLADIFTQVYRAGAATILGPASIFRRNQDVPPPRQPPSLPPDHR